MIPHRTLVRRRVRQLLPFLLALTVAFGFLALPPESHRTSELLVAAAISAGVTAVSIAAPWHLLPRVCQVLPAMAFLPVIMILRDMEGGAGSGYAALLVLPVLWLALYSGGAAVAIAVAGVAAALVTPILIAGDPRYPSSEWRWTGITVTVVAVTGYTVLRLVARSRRLAARLAELAATDPLTLLPNRRSWDEQLSREIARARRSGNPLSVALVDLDGLKAVNDEFGHLAGDALLQDCARAWQRTPGRRTSSPATAATSSRCCCRAARFPRRWSSSTGYARRRRARRARAAWPSGCPASRSSTCCAGPTSGSTRPSAPVARPSSPSSTRCRFLRADAATAARASTSYGLVA